MFTTFCVRGGSGTRRRHPSIIQKRHPSIIQNSLYETIGLIRQVDSKHCVHTLYLHTRLCKNINSHKNRYYFVCVYFVYCVNYVGRKNFDHFQYFVLSIQHAILVSTLPLKLRKFCILCYIFAGIVLESLEVSLENELFIRQIFKFKPRFPRKRNIIKICIKGTSWNV